VHYSYTGHEHTLRDDIYLINIALGVRLNNCCERASVSLPSGSSPELRK
jgi:hypothetical protein